MTSLRSSISKRYFENWMPRKYGGTWQRRFDWAQANISRDPQQMDALRLRLLGDLLRHAASEVPYYQALFSQLGVKPDELLEPQCFARLPLLTRSHLRQQLGQLIAEDAGRYRLEHSSTSGSTGIPTHYYHGTEYARQSAVNIVRNQLWTGWRYGEPVVKIWGWVSAFNLTFQDRLRIPVDDMLRNEIRLPAYHMTSADLRRWPVVLHQRRPSLMIGYVNAMIALAQGGALLSDVGLKGVVATAETLFPAQRSLLEQAYGCKVFNRYGCRELSTIAHECAYGRLHVNEDWVNVEIVDSHGAPVPAGQVGQIVLTGYFTFGMPFIRYAIEDAGAFPEQETPCPCGCRFRSLDRLEGKLQDLISLPGGGYVSGEFFAGVLRHHPVRQFQVLQPAIDRLEVLLVPVDGYSAQDEDEMRKLILDYCPDTTVTFQQMEEIPLTVSGKRRLTVSQVSGADSLYR
jgi:phenylacetate-CoA ligase